MDAATSPTDPTEPNGDASASSDYSTPLLEALFTGRDRRHQATGSFIYGILGIAVFAIATSAIAGFFFAWAYQSQFLEQLNPVFSVSLLLVFAAMVYPTVVLALQLFASLRTQVTVRVVLIYATLYACLRALTFGIPTPIDGASLLICAPICLGGLIQHRFTGWNAVGWSQQARAPAKVTIASLLDLTATIAITMGIASTIEFNPKGLACLLPTFLILAIVGMHPWARLVVLCDDKQQRNTGFGFWMLGNVIWGCGMFLLIAMLESSIRGLLAIAIPPLVIVIAHYYTALPLAWLKACGWKFVRAEASTSKLGAQTATFNSSI